ncbi:MAG: hydroxyacid dehydrogenase [Burkholderiales bacterium]|nr:hydroxyacid dehydrogenase [Phycisphaerae bacterium]
MLIKPINGTNGRHRSKAAKPKGLFILDADAFELSYGDEHYKTITSQVEIIAEPQTRESIARTPELLGPVDYIFSGWGMPTTDRSFLAQAPRLEAIFYAAGATGGWITDEVWRRGITVTSAISANSTAVAEYTLATVLMSLKHAWPLARQTREQRRFVGRNGAPGCYGSVVGIISLGEIARQLIALLKPFDLKLIAYDPFVSDDSAAALGVERVSLADLFTRADVVSVHTPVFPETLGMITGKLLQTMKHGATLINTARGCIVREAEMISVLSRRPDLQAVLDVTDPIEPPVPESPLYTLPNVFLTPHIAGSVGSECRRMGRYMVEELQRYQAGEPLKWQVTDDATARNSHRPINTFLRAPATGAVAGAAD